MNTQKKYGLIDHDQNWFQLGTIISTSITLPMMMIGNQLAERYGSGQAICSILVGNLILWLIGMAVISMAMEDRSNALENIEPYLGRSATILVWFILIVSLLNWFAHQISAVIPSIGLYFNIEKKFLLVRLGAAIGFLTTLLSVGGIRVIKWLVGAGFPFIFFYHVYSLVSSDLSVDPISTLGLSFPAVISTMLVLFPGVINLPTLFRHARSKADCYLGLALMVLLMAFFEISTIWMKFDQGNIVYKGSTDSFFSLVTVIFLIVTLIYMNLLNIYFTSACWETYFHRFENGRGYAVTGLLGTAAYTFIQVYTPILFFENLTNCYLANLGVILLGSYLVRLFVRHRPRTYEKMFNGLCWLIGCIASTALVIQDIHEDVHSLLISMAISAAAFSCVIFVEENIWATRKIIYTKQT